MKIAEFHNDFTAIVEPDPDGGFVAFCAEIPSANGQGETEQNAIDNLIAGIKFVLQHHRDERFAQMSEDARCYKVSVHEESQADPLSAQPRMRPAS